MKLPFFFIICQLATAVAATAQVFPDPEAPLIPPGLFNIINYGAIGDGVKDNTTNIQNAINAANTLLSTMTAATGSTPLTTIFDALAFGWRGTGSTASTMTVSSLTITGQSTAPAIGYTSSGSTLTLNWPTNYRGWLLQSNSAGLASGNWSTVPGSGNLTGFSVTIDSAKTNVFYRLVSPSSL